MIFIGFQIVGIEPKHLFEYIVDNFSVVLIMLTHFFTLRALCREISPLLENATILEVFTQRRNELLVSIRSTALSHPVTLCISVEPRMNYFLLRDRVSRARRNSVDLFPELVGETVAGVRMQNRDRTVGLHMENGLHLLSRLYDTATSNVILIDRQNVIHESFKHDKELKGTRMSVSPSAAPENDSLGRLAALDGETPFGVMKELFPHFGTLYLREVFHRTDVDEKAKSLPPELNARLVQEAESLEAELLRPMPVIYRWDGVFLAFAVIPLRSLAGLEEVRPESVNEGMRDVLPEIFRERAFVAEKRRLLKNIALVKDRLSHGGEKSSQAGSSAEYERKGKLLLAHLAEVTKGMSRVSLPDFLDGAYASISLDPKLTARQNAEKYFARAKKEKLAKQESKSREEALAGRRRVIEEIEGELSRAESLANIKRIRAKYSQEFKRMGIGEDDETKPLPFRIFKVAGELEVWVGKSSAGNDLLTMKYARPNDLWFHVRGASGSHAILRVRAGTPPPKEAVYQTAAIAAYYSKMRSARDAPVAFCERKYVRKPKGAPPGTVAMQRERVIFVTPRLP